MMVDTYHVTLNQQWDYEYELTNVCYSSTRARCARPRARIIF